MAASAMTTMDAATAEGIRSATAPMIRAWSSASSAMSAVAAPIAVPNRTGSLMNVVVRSAASR